MDPARPAIEINHIFKSLLVGDQRLDILKGIDLRVEMGDFLIIFGPSGCGKSTLLHAILGLEPPSSGKVIVLGEDLFALGGEDEISEFRKKHIGMIFQQPHWIKALTVIENVAFPLSLVGMGKAEALEKAKQYLNVVGMIDWAERHPSDLSSGQQQKVAMARGLIKEPEIIVADEPTGNLDYESGIDVLLLLQKLNIAGKTILMVTHDLEYLAYAKTAVKMFDGLVVGVYQGEHKADLAKDIHYKRGVASPPVDQKT